MATWEKSLKSRLYLDNFQAINSKILQSEIRTRILKVTKKEKWFLKEQKKQKKFCGKHIFNFLFSQAFSHVHIFYKFFDFHSREDESLTQKLTK